MRRFPLLAIVAFAAALPLAANVLAQNSAPEGATTMKGKIEAKVPLGSGYRITLRTNGATTATVTLSKGPKRVLRVVQARQMIRTNGETPTTTLKGDVVIQVELEGKRLMEFDADEATLVVEKEE